MAKLTLTDIQTQFQSTTELNNNFTLIENALENTVSRDGTTPNHMDADLDLNSNDLINVGNVSTSTITIAGVDLSDSANNVAYSEEWANKAEDSLVSTDAGGDGVDDYSALHHANKAAGSAASAALSAREAAASNPTSPIHFNEETIDADITFAVGFNGHSVGPLTISAGVTVDTNGQNWVIR